jgi:outer membrane biosynthesis protein TonB
MVKQALIGLVVIAACGGKQQTQPDMTSPAQDENSPPPAQDESANMIPPEKMDEVQQDLKRKEMIVSHCLASSMEAGEVPRGTHGHVRFEIKIGTDGHATDVSVDKTDIQAKSVIDCAKKHVMDTAFPTLPHPYETSYMFAMEAN